MYKTTEGLARRGHTIDLVTIGSPAAPDVAAMERICRLRAVSGDTSNRMGAMLANLFSTRPYTLSKYDQPAVAREVERIVVAASPDAVQIDSLHMSWYLPVLRRISRAPVFLRAHNVEHVIWERYAATERRPWRKYYAWLQGRRVRAFERRWAAEYTGVLAISQDDAERLSRISPGARLHVVPAGIDPQEWPALPTAPSSMELLFVGSLDWFPNYDGISWFAREVFPLVQKHCPGSRLTIVGSKPNDMVRSLVGPAVTLCADVPDVREYYSRAAVVVVPLRVGGGVRLKILEALAFERPVVSTTVGCEGLRLTAGEDLLIADTPWDLAAATVELLRHPAHAAALARA